MQENEQILKPENANQGIDMSIQGAPKILIEILVFGLEKDKELIHESMINIQRQITKFKQDNRVRILFYLDKGEKSDEEKKKWLIDNSSCKYYVFLNEDNENYYVSKEYVKDLTLTVKRLESSVDKMKEMGIILKPRPLLQFTENGVNIYHPNNEA